MNLLLNHKDVEKEINNRLKSLRRYSLSETKKTDIDELANCISQIHSYDLKQSNLPLYNSRWVINLVTARENCKYKNDIISALEIMSEMEYYNTDVEVQFNDKKFLTWDIVGSSWQKEYETGNIGSYVWDIAIILNYVNDSSFSDIFLERYMCYGCKKPTLISIYVNLYYVQVAVAVMNDNLGSIMPITIKILKQNMFKTDIISVETLSRLRILGY